MIVLPKSTDWAAIANNPKFEEIHRRKTVFLFGWWIFSTIYYFLLYRRAEQRRAFFSVKVIETSTLV